MRYVMCPVERVNPPLSSGFMLMCIFLNSAKHRDGKRATVKWRALDYDNVHICVLDDLPRDLAAARYIIRGMSLLFKPEEQ